MATPKPTDLFTSLHPVFDEVRGVLTELGLRRYRTFLYIRIYAEPGKRGGVEHALVEEITPSPLVEFLSAAQIAMSQGLLQQGSVRLSKIRGDFLEEHLRGRTEFGDDLPETWHFSYALCALGQRAGMLYAPASAPIQRTTDWTILLRPLNERVDLPVPPEPGAVP